MLTMMINMIMTTMIIIMTAVIVTVTDLCDIFSNVLKEESGTYKLHERHMPIHLVHCLGDVPHLLSEFRCVEPQYVPYIVCNAWQA